MDNRPEFIITWLGLAKAGCTIALINTNLLGEPLIYSMDISKAQRFIIGSFFINYLTQTLCNPFYQKKVWNILKKLNWEWTVFLVRNGSFSEDPSLVPQTSSLSSEILLP